MAFIGCFTTVYLQVDPIWHGMSLRVISEGLGALSLFYWLLFPFREKMCFAITKKGLGLLHELCLGFLSFCVFLELPEKLRPLTWAVFAVALLLGTLRFNGLKRFFLYSWCYLIASITHLTFITDTLPFHHLESSVEQALLILMTLAIQVSFLFVCLKNQKRLCEEALLSPAKNFCYLIFQQPCLTILLPIVLGVALMLGFNYEKALLTVLWVGLTCLYLTLSLIMRSKISVQVSMCALGICSLRLIIFDLTQTNLSVRALVFLGVGLMMLLISVLYKKFKHRIEPRETA